jgi:DNA invertase Pin-like site-specific DNA recombinase
MIGAVVEFERSLILERQREGVALAKQRGAYKGRQPALKGPQIEKLHALLAGGMSKARAARELGVSRDTVYKYLSVSTTTTEGEPV